MNAGWSRRTFLRSVAGAAAAPWVMSSCSGEAERAGGERADVSGTGFTFDLHTHPGAFFQRGLPGYAGDEGFTARVQEMASAGVSAFHSIVADWKVLELTASGVRQVRALEPGEGWEDYRRQLRDLRELMGPGIVTGLDRLDAARAEGTSPALVAVEGGDFLEGDVGRLAEAHADGVRSIQLVHYAQNDVGDLQTQPPVHGGLSPFGLDVVDAMVELGVLIDVAHASFRTVEAVAERAGVPIILSHSILNTPERSHPRHIDEDHARLIAGTGGVIGMWPSGFGSSTLDEFVDHTMRLIEVVGVDHVGLGTDMDGNYQPVIADYGDCDDWVRKLGERGLSDAEVARIAGGNARRVLEAVL